MRGRYQGGSLAGFIIIGALLALVLIGGLYGLNRYNAEQSKEIATEETESGTGTGEAAGNEEPTPTNDKTDQDSSNSQGSSADADSQENSNSDSQASQELPATGPADTFIAAVAVVAATLIVTYYVQGRSHKRH